MVKENHWKQVTPDMMSEEDENGEFIRHRPQWRSTSFNVFVEKLDKRYKLKHEKTLDRMVLSMPIKFHLLTFHPG